MAEGELNKAGEALSQGIKTADDKINQVNSTVDNTKQEIGGAVNAASSAIEQTKKAANDAINQGVKAAEQAFDEQVKHVEKVQRFHFSNDWSSLSSSIYFYFKGIDETMKVASDSIDHKIQEANTFVATKRQDLEKVMKLTLEFFILKNLKNFPRSTLKNVQDIAAKAHEATDTQAAGLLGKLHLGK